ncbi:MAG: hypothetical protein ABI687_08760, partial [Flavitalea sp.]
MKKHLPLHRLYIRLLLLLMSITLHNVLTAQIKFGNSYVNLTKKTIGGTIEPGDSLEIRTNIWFSSGWNSNTIYAARYVDNVPANTTFADVSLRLITNEGLTYKTWTLAAGDDPGTYNASPTSGQYNVKINLGRYATTPTSTNNDAIGAYNLITGGSSATRDKPIAGGGLLITTSFKVKVTGNVGDTIILGAGKIYYKNSSGGSDLSKSATQYKILISNSSPICSNAVGRNFVGEAGGTFDSGAVQNRALAPTTIPNYVYIANMSSGNQIYDGNFAIVNNLSPTASTFQNAQKKNSCVAASGPTACVNRMFTGYWDIIGDHTGSATSAGNAPVSPGTLGGYMLAVNADYATTEAYRQTISGLCPNTSYEFSLWVKNICTNCGMDSAGVSKY